MGSKKVFDVTQIDGEQGLHDLIHQVRECGKIGLNYYKENPDIPTLTKSDSSPVTLADQSIETHLRKFLLNRFPHFGFYGEETGEDENKEATTGRFIVDPIDGTRAFIRNIPTWSILVGLEIENEPVLGIGYFPVSDELYFAMKGHGAFLLDAENKKTKLQVSNTPSLDQAMICHGSLQQFTDEGLEEVLIALGKQTFSQRGFADFDGYRQILLGRADAMVDPGVKPWDICPAAVLIREAGGTFTSMDGSDTIYGQNALASNGRVHPQLLALIEPNC